MRNRLHKVAVVDSGAADVRLYWADADDNLVKEIVWPRGWPERVHDSFLRRKGYRVVYA